MHREFLDLLPLGDQVLLLSVPAILLLAIRVWRREQMPLWLSASDEIPFLLWAAMQLTGTRITLSIWRGRTLFLAI